MVTTALVRRTIAISCVGSSASAATSGESFGAPIRSRTSANLAVLLPAIAHFSGPPTSNPKLVNYLAAGSVQGLRPLRYEKRVARNRLLLLLAILIAVLWGLAVIIFGRR